MYLHTALAKSHFTTSAKIRHRVKRILAFKQTKKKRIARMHVYLRPQDLSELDR